MSQSASSAAYSPGCIDTLIGAGMRIVGNVTCSGVLRVQGDIEGDVACGSGGGEGGLVIDGTGSVTGTVTAHHVAVRGRIVGPVRSSRVVEVHSGASVVGDILFAGLAIHPGGVIMGALTPTPGTAAALHTETPPAATPHPAVAPAETGATPEGAGGRWKLPAVAILAIAIGLAIWKGRGTSPAEPTADPVALRSTPALHEEKASSPPADVAAAPAARKEALQSAPTPPSAREAPAVAQPDPSSLGDDGDGEAVEIRGANASRPPGVFLLVTSEPTTLYRKKRGDPGEGARIAVGAGERVSVSVGDNELIRVAKGPNAVIFYQGKKVPGEVIGSGAWMSFLPR